MEKHRVVITGMGIVAPNAANVEAFQVALLSGRSGIRFSPEMEALNLSCTLAGKAEIPVEIPSFFQKNRFQNMSDFIQLACLAGVEAWQHASLAIPSQDDDAVDWETGILIGTGTPGVDTLAHQIVPLVNSGQARQIGGYGSLNIMGSAPGAFLSSILGTGNMSAGNSSACCTGLDAIVESYYRIRSGRAKRMLAGSAEGYAPHKWATLDALRILNNSMNDRPEKASRPLSASAAGLIPASGAGVLVLESLSSAQERGATIYGEIRSAFSNNGGQRNGGSLTFPNKDGVIRCLNTAIQQSGLNKEQIDLISGHFTATKADPFEFNNWRTVFDGDHFPMLNATKSMIGHGLASAGAMESIACLLQLQHDFIHPSINCEDLHADITASGLGDRIPQKAIENAGLKNIIKASFGFGDVNSAVIFGKYEG